MTARRALDAYYTPDALAAALVGLLPIEATDTVLEPHAGGGAFVRALLPVAHRVLACDVDPEAEGLRLAHSAHRADFLALSSSPWARWTVGNPPFRGFEEHVEHGLKVSRHVAYLLRLAVMESAGRVPMWQRWPLRKVWVLAERPSFTGGSTDSAAYGFFWWDRAYSGPAEVVPGWSWKGGGAA
jgi:hypothetical protein